MSSPIKSGKQNSLFAPSRFVTDNVCVTKSLELLAFFETDGVDLESATDAELNEQHRDLVTAFGQLSEAYSVHQYLVKTVGAKLQEPMYSGVPTDDLTKRYRHEYLAKHADLCTIKSYVCLSFAAKRIPSLYSSTFSVSIRRSELNEHISKFESQIRSFERNTSRIIGLRRMDKREAFRFLRFLVSLDGRLADAEPLHYENNVDHWMASSMLNVHPWGIRVGDVPVTVLTLRRRPQACTPAMLRELMSIPGNQVYHSCWNKRPFEEVKKAVDAATQHFDVVKTLYNVRSVMSKAISRGREQVVPDESSIEAVAELGKISIGLSHGETMGKFSLTGVFWDPTHTGKASSFIDAQRVVGKHGGSLMQETSWATGALSSLVPGTPPKWRHRQRSMWATTSQYVDMFLLHGHSSGSAVNKHLNKESLVTLTTSDFTPYHLNLHQGGVMGALVFGIPGSGKTMLSQLFADHSIVKYKPMTLVLDGLGASYKTLTEKHDGHYFALDPDSEWPFRLNPFHIASSRKNVQYLSMLIRSCMVSGGFRPNAKRNQAMYTAIGKVMNLPLTERRISRLELPDDMMMYLQPWIGSGQYGFVFDNPEDTFRLSSTQTIDFSAMDEFPDVLQPLLLHFFYLWNQIIYDPALLGVLKQMIVDEGWKMISYPAARRYIKTAGRTWRKRNGGIVLITQSIEELQDSKILSIVNELCPTKFLMYNPGGDFSRYATVLNLNERQVEMYRSLRGQGDVLFKSPGTCKILRFDPDPLAYWTYTNNPNDNPKREEYIARYGFKKGLQELADERERTLSAMA